MKWAESRAQQGRTTGRIGSGAMRPHYVTTPYGQLRLWLDGTGPTLVVVSGPVRAASVIGVALRAALPGWRVIAVEPPGLGGSATVPVGSATDMAAQVGTALEFLVGEPFTLAACDLSIALLPHLVSRLRPVRTVLIDPDAGLGWVERGLAPPTLTPHEDGTHLNALWSFIRDRRLVRPDDPRLPVVSGPEPPDVDDLAATFVAAAVAPESFSRFWNEASAAYFDAWTRLKDRCELTSSRPEAVSHALGTAPAVTQAAPPPTAPAPGTGIWHQYLDTVAGRAHLRRAGSSGAPLLACPPGAVPRHNLHRFSAVWRTPEPLSLSTISATAYLNRSLASLTPLTWHRRHLRWSTRSGGTTSMFGARTPARAWLSNWRLSHRSEYVGPCSRHRS